MNVGEHDRYPAAVLIRSAVLFHPDSSDAPESRTLASLAAHDTIGKGGNLLREMNLSPREPERSRLYAEVDGGQKGIGQRKMLEIVEDDSSESEPEREQRETPAALTEKDREPYPKEAAHGPSTSASPGAWYTKLYKVLFLEEGPKSVNGRPVGTRT